MEFDVESVILRATHKSSKAIFLDNSGTQNITLNEGENIVEIKVKAENDEVKVYVVKINKKSKVVTEQDDNTDVNEDNNITTYGKDDKIDESPKTGNSIVYLFVLLFVISIPFCKFAYKKYKRNEV